MIFRHAWGDSTDLEETIYGKWLALINLEHGQFILRAKDEHVPLNMIKAIKYLDEPSTLPMIIVDSLGEVKVKKLHKSALGSP